MNKSLLKDTFREIKKTKARFFSIFAIVLIGTGFFAGVLASAPVMRYNADHYYDDYNLMDVRVVSNFGLTKEDITEIRKVNGVESVMASYEKDVLFSMGTSQNVLRVHSIDLDHLDSNDNQYMNQLIVKEGRLPEKSGECVVEKAKLSENRIHIGDTIRIVSGDDSNIYDTFNKTSFTVCGIIETPYYNSYEKGSSSIGSGEVNLFAYIPSIDFSMDVYTEAFITISGAKPFNCHDEEYFDYIEPVTDKLEELGMERSEIRKADIMDEAMEAYNDGLKEYEDGLNEFNEEIEKAEQKLKDGEDELLKGNILLTTNKSLAEIQFTSAQSDIDSAKATLKILQDAYNEAEKTYKTSNADAIKQKEDVTANLNDAKARQSEKQTAYDQSKEKYDELTRLNNEKIDKQNQLTQAETRKIILETELTQLEARISIASDEEKEALEQEYNSKKAERDTNDALISTLTQEIANLPDYTQQLVDAQVELSYATAELNQVNSEVAAYEATIQAIDQGLSVYTKALEEMDTQIQKMKDEISAGEETLAAEKEKADKEFKAAQQKLDDGALELAEGRIELEKQRKEGEEKLEDAREELVKAKNDIDSIAEAKWYVLDRESHYGYMDYKGATERMGAIAKVFPVFFFLIAALVCLTTMTRMVDEQRGQIGTMKALGYSTKDIAFKYVFYAFIASLMGSIIGLMLGTVAFPFIIYTAWNMMYVLPPMRIYYIPSIMILSAISCIAVTTGAAFMACYRELIETPALLMRPKAPKLGKKILLERIPFIWNHLSFTSKVTARNLFRYKKRFLMTVIGISGCTALLIAGFGIQDSISTLVDTQFSEIFHYDGAISMNNDFDHTKSDEFRELIIDYDEIDDVLGVYTENTSIFFNGKSEDMTVVVPNNVEQFETFVDLHERVSKKPITLRSSGIVITEHTANHLGCSVGDSVEIRNKDGINASFEIIGISENYINHYTYMSATCYKNAYDVRAKVNTYFIRIAEEYKHNDSEVASILTGYDEVETVSFYTATIDNFQNMIKSLNYIVIVLIISAGALAFVVLYNLTNVNISERLKEIATLKVLGFYDKEVNSYVYRENIILTLIGALAGLGLGKILHLTIMVLVELDTVMFGRNIDLSSYIYSIVITLLFGILVNNVMKRRLRNIPMVESLKSVE